MAAEGDVELELETEENCSERPADKPRKHDSGAADLERVTDYAEEKEIQSSNLETAMSVIGDRRSREQKAKQEREKELAKVTIKKEDVELIMNEMEIPRSAAERSLREHMGNVVEALISLSNWTSSRNKKNSLMMLSIYSSKNLQLEEQETAEMHTVP